MDKGALRQKQRLVIAGLLLTAGAAALVLWGAPLLAGVKNLVRLLGEHERIKECMAPLGPWAPLAFIGIQAGQVVLAPIPGEASGFAGGYLFGLWPGLLYSTIGLSLGSLANFYLGRFLGRRYLRYFLSERRIARFHDLLRHQGVMVGFLLFVIPGFPKDTLCLIMGVGSMPAAAFFVISTVGRIPGTLLLSVQGASLYDKQYTTLAAVLAAAAIVGAAAAWNKKRIYRLMERLK